MEQNFEQNNKRIAKNTLLLYARMLAMMFIGLFTTRVILNALGVSDLGLMNVAGGIVSMFMFLNGTLASGTQRFISYEIGSNNVVKLRKVFRSAMTLHLLLAFIIVILSETIGLWYMYNKLNVEPGRFEAALWCFHLSVISCFLGIIQVPFMSCLVAHEKMDTFAYMTIFDALNKLVSAYLIMIVPWDKVIFYSSLGFIFSLVSIAIYNWYCRKHFEECSFSFGYDKSIFKEMLSFSGWNAFGCLAATAQSTGVNLVINFFCGTVVNGARGIAFQANSWVTRFVDNFQVALNPQIIKYYAAGQIEKFSNLVIRGAQLSSLLLLLLGIPVFLEIEWLINLWLGKTPEYVPIFLRILMIETLFRTMGNPTIMAMHATGKMKMLNLTVGIILLLIVPISYTLFEFGVSVEIVVAANVIPWMIVPFVRIYWLNRYTDNQFPIKRYLKLYIKIPILAVIIFIISYFVKIGINRNDFFSVILIGIISIIIAFITIYVLGISSNDRNFIKKNIRLLFMKIYDKYKK